MCENAIETDRLTAGKEREAAHAARGRETRSSLVSRLLSAAAAAEALDSSQEEDMVAGWRASDRERLRKTGKPLERQTDTERSERSEGQRASQEAKARNEGQKAGAEVSILSHERSTRTSQT